MDDVAGHGITSVDSRLGCVRSILCLLTLAALAIPCAAESIEFPAFGVPIVTDKLIITCCPYFGHTPVLAIDRQTNKVLWRVELPQSVFNVTQVDADRFLAVGKGTLYLLDFAGRILQSQDLPGTLVGGPQDGKVWCCSYETHRIFCIAFMGDKVFWELDPNVEGSNAWPTLVGDLILLSVSPATISLNISSEGERTTFTGANRVVCLRASDGQQIWSEDVPLDEHSYGVSLRVASGKDAILCSTDSELLVLDPKSGAIKQRYQAGEGINGVDFWGKDRLAMCLGGLSATTRTIRVLSLSDRRILDEFQVERQEVASLTTVGDVAVLGSVYRDVGVDLQARRIAWDRFQLHWDEHDGLIYYGAPNDQRESHQWRILGVLDPKTGKDTELYREAVKLETQKAASQPADLSQR